LSDLVLDELVVGELTGGETRAAGEHVRTCTV